jgi:hypothetical protein
MSPKSTELKMLTSKILEGAIFRKRLWEDLDYNT